HFVVGDGRYRENNKLAGELFRRYDIGSRGDYEGDHPQKEKAGSRFRRTTIASAESRRRAMSDYIVDTNVWVAASEEGDFTGEEMDTCREFLEMIKQTAAAKIVMDQASFEDGDTPGNSVLDELKRNLTEGSYAFDLFYKHILRDFRIELIELSYDEEG